MWDDGKREEKKVPQVQTHPRSAHLLTSSPHSISSLRSYLLRTHSDATIGLGVMQTDPTQWKKTSVEELTLQEHDTMRDWRTRFLAKYQVVGALTDGAHPSSIESLKERGILPK
jgi:hypothetical protein